MSWPVKQLGDVLQRTESVDPRSLGKSNFCYIDVSSVSNETLNIEEVQTLAVNDAPSRARRFVRNGDVLFATIRPTLRRIAIVPEYLDKEICSTGYLVLRPKPELSNRFVFYFLQSQKFMAAMEELQKGASYPAVTDAEVRMQRLPIPPLAEQHRIVAILDEAFAGIATAKANADTSLRCAAEVLDSASQNILDAVSGEEMSLESVAAEDCSLSYGIVQPGDDVEGGLPVVRPVDLTREFITLEGLKRIDPELAASYKRTKLQGGELLLCVRGTTGTVSIADPELEGANVTRGIVAIRFKAQQVLPSFGYHLMRSAGVQSQIREKTYGTALMQINIGDLRRISVRIPTLTQQQSLSDRLDGLRKEAFHLQSLYTRKLAALDELKQSLLQQAFSGQL